MLLEGLVGCEISEKKVPRGKPSFVVRAAERLSLVCCSLWNCVQLVVQSVRHPEIRECVMFRPRCSVRRDL